MYRYEYPRPAVTVDVVIFSMRADDLVVLLVKRKLAPYKGQWALPGGFVNPNESLERACARELEEETGLSNVRFQQLGAFGDPGRDPRGHTISVAFFTFIVAESAILRAGDDAAEVAWHPLANLAKELPTGTHPAPGRRVKTTRAAVGKGAKPAKPGRPSRATKKGTIELAFDHRRIIDMAQMCLVERLRDPTRAASFDLVPSHFTMSELQRVYEVVLQRPLDKRNFRAKLLAAHLIEPASASRRGPHRPAQLYRWKGAAR